MGSSLPMKKLFLSTVVLIAVLASASCNESDVLAHDYLAAQGYVNVICRKDGLTAAVCVADGKRFRCVSSSQSGCGAGLSSVTTACEPRSPVGPAESP